MTGSYHYLIEPLLGSALLGLAGGLMGGFILVRRLSLLGDTIAHAVLPGVVIGFAWQMEKTASGLFVGALVAGLLAALLTGAIRQTTILKEDTAQGILLGGFYAVGILLLRLVQNAGTGGSTGIEGFLFGQAAALTRADVYVIATVTLAAVLLVVVFYRTLLVVSFDAVFAAAIGWSPRLWQSLILFLLALAVVVSLQAVGAVLAPALLIIPPATAALLTKRFPALLVLSSALGLLAGVGGCLLSLTRTGLATGPLIVLCSAACFAIAFMVAPQRGVLWQVLRHRGTRRRMLLEHGVKAVFQAWEDRDFAPDPIPVAAVRQRFSGSNWQLATSIRHMRQRGWLTHDGQPVTAGPPPPEPGLKLSPTGWQHASSVVRKHRLWELYLSHAAAIAPDHVHDDADTIEHILNDEQVTELMARLNHPHHDPHGRWIPQVDSPYPAPRP
jgi:ABC-type Mn2+/Zn2+ transport system permease subunit